MQLFMIHGGMTFKNREDYLDWLKSLEPSLDDTPFWRDVLVAQYKDTFQIIAPRFPCKEFAQYEEWKIHFENHFHLLEENIILLGNSLGSIFLAKYLAENEFPKKIKAVLLVCPPFDDSLSEEDLAGGFEKTPTDFSKLNNCTENLHLFFSKDDTIVPIAHAEKYREQLPHANIHIYESKNGHFLVEEFPELAALLKTLS